MAKSVKDKQNALTKLEDLQVRKIQVFFKRSILNLVLKILTMQHSGFRTFKSVKNINRLFTNIDESLYKKNPELLAYIWCIAWFSKQWLDGIVTTDLIVEGAKRQPDFDNVKEEIINACIKDDHIISEAEAKMIFEMVGEALQYGYLSSVKHEYQSLLEDITFDHPGAFKELAGRLFDIAHSLIDIKHSTNFVTNKVTFNTNDSESVKEALTQTIESLTGTNACLVTGIRRLNSLLSPGYMPGKLYIYIGLPSSGKSMMLLKSVLDIRKYNPGYKCKTPGMKPCALYITMENSFTETIERIWNISFDDSIADYTPEEAIYRLGNELGLNKIINDDQGNAYVKTGETNASSEGKKLTLDILAPIKALVPNIEIVIKYFSYREINTDDLFTIIQDLRDENLEVIALSFDYIKRIRPNVVALDSVKMELNRIVNELKAMAVVLDIPVITAHQMNRASATIVDSAIRQGKSDVTKLVGRDGVGDALTSWASKNSLTAGIAC